jgi:hypothetical protein
LLKRISEIINFKYEQSKAVLVLLLVIAGEARETELLATLRGESWSEKDLRQAQMQGYYEKLLDASPISNRTSNESVAKNEPPPFAVFPFRDAGIVEEVPTYLRWRMRPNLVIRWNGATFRTNSLGFRTPEVEREKPARTYRIVVFGSSNTMGHGVNDDDPYPRLLERWLNEQIGPTRRVEVVNLAVSGDSPTRRLQRLREEGGRFGADWLLCDATVFDYSLEEDHLKAIVLRNIPIPFDFVREALRRSGVTAADSPASFQRKLRDESEWLLDGAYSGWSEEAKRLGIPMTVVILPRTNRKIESLRMFRQIRTLADRHGLDYLDLSGAFRDLEENRIQVSPWDNHPGALGHRAIFEALRSALQRRGGLPGLPLSHSQTQERRGLAGDVAAAMEAPQRRDLEGRGVGDPILGSKLNYLISYLKF